MAEIKFNWNILSSILLGVISMIGIALVGNGTYLSIIGLVVGCISLKEIKNTKWIAWLGIFLNAVGLGSLVI